MMKGCCIHFNGIQSDNCEAGVEYLEVARPLSQDEIDLHNKWYPDSPLERTAIAKRIPCFVEHNVHTCSKFQLPTKQELADYEKRMNEWVKLIVAMVNTVRPLIIKQVGVRKRKYVRDKIDCPICKNGIVQFAYHGHVNRHVQAECTNEDCIVRWIGEVILPKPNIKNRPIWDGAFCKRSCLTACKYEKTVGA